MSSELRNATPSQSPELNTAAWLRAVLNATPECIKLVANDGSLLHMNAAGMEMVGVRDLNAIYRKPVFSLITEQHRHQWLESHRRVCLGEQLCWEYQVLGSGGSLLWVETHAVPIELPDGTTGQLAITRDISSRKLIEEERQHLLEAEQAARTQAERASRIKDEFLATLSHELRTPLTAILGWAQLLLASPPSDIEFNEGLEIIERNARHQAQIIEDLLDMSRIISGKIRLDARCIDLPPIIEAAIGTVRPAADAKGIRLQSVLDPNAGPVTGDPNRLHQVLWNLLLNAIKFSPKESRIQVFLQRINSHVELSVIDEGQGIEPEFMPFVFDRFRQADSSTSRVHGGLGLGLSITKQLVELHGGTIGVESRGKGQGCTFKVCLPIVSVYPDQQEMRSDSGNTGPAANWDYLPVLKGIRALILDDEPDSRELVKRLLIQCGAEVSDVGTSAEALTQISSHPDVIISDIGMPGEDGYTFIRKVRELESEMERKTPAIALTAYARSEDRRRALLCGFQMHSSKPVDPAELLAMVASLVGRTR